MDGSLTKSSVPREILFQLKDIVTKLIFNIEAATEDVYNRIIGTVDCFPFLQKTISDAVTIGIACEAHFVPMKYKGM